MSDLLNRISTAAAMYSMDYFQHDERPEGGLDGVLAPIIEPYVAQRDALLAAAKGLMSEFDSPVPDIGLKAFYREQLRQAIQQAEGDSK